MTLYGTPSGASFLSAFTCSSFATDTATVCAVATNSVEGTKFWQYFQDNEAAFIKLSLQFYLICVNTGPNTYIDMASVAACGLYAQKSPNCPQIVVTFPECACINTTGATPFSFSKTVVETTNGKVAGVNTNLYTFTIVTGPGIGKGAQQTVAAKAEFMIAVKNRKYVLGSYVGTRFVPPSFGSPTEQPNTYKVNFNDLANGVQGISVGQANGLKVSIIVDASVTLGELLPRYPDQIYYAIFSPDQKWCPVDYAFPPTD